MQASERVPLWQAGALSTVLVVSWVLVGPLWTAFADQPLPDLAGVDTEC